MDDCQELLEGEESQGLSLIVAQHPQDEMYLWEGEFLIKPHLVYFALLGLCLLEIKGNLVIKIHETNTLFTQNLVWIIS